MFNLSRKNIRQYSSALAVVLFLTAGCGVAAERNIAFQIPKENAAQALNDFAQQAGVHILFPYDLAAAHTTSAISGSYTRDECLALILKDSGLEIAEQSEGSITLRAAKTPAQVSERASETPTEVIVTGTHIRGTNPTSPVHTVSRTDIDQSGYSQIGDLVRSLPENFSGGQNPGVYGAGDGLGNSNLSNASTLNLRGLGTGASLVLLNGHRLSADTLYQGSDISGVPMGAVQRIEIVPDGASALYGSDAVAGVANIILRRNYSGVEISARLGTTSQGGGDEHTYSFLGGLSSSKAYGLVSLEYSKQSAVTEGQRSFVESDTPDVTLLQPQTRQSAFLSAGYDLSDQTKLSFDGLLSDRSSTSIAQSSPAFQYNYAYATPAYSAAVTLDTRLTSDWKLKVTGVMSGSRNTIWVRIPAFSYASDNRFKNEVQYVETVADGSIVTLPTGQVKLAVGGGYRAETYRQNYLSATGGLTAKRKVQYAFAETLIPLVRQATERVGLNALELSLSVRGERYSDFGSSTNPKIGIRYVPMPGLRVRATTGTSFKAPSFYEMHQSTEIALFPGSYFGLSAPATALVSIGGNPDLKPEKSKSWTVGVDYDPSVPANVVISATYFDIDYTDRVVQPVPNYRSSLGNAIYDAFIERMPTAARQADLIAGVDLFENFTAGAYDPASVVALIHNENTNAASQHVSGVDASYRQSLSVGGGKLDVFAAGTWLNLEQKTIPSLPPVKLSGTVFYTPKFKGRGGLSWQRGGVAATAIANFVSGETDTSVTPSRNVASWTTVDATASYGFDKTAGLLNGVRLVFSASNVFDKKPPRLLAPTTLGYPGIYYDSTNSSIIGRFVSFTVVKAW